MATEVKPLAEITHEALSLLCRQLGVADTIRFLGQFTSGHGNYTEERRATYANVSLDEIVAEIERARVSQVRDEGNEGLYFKE